MQKLLEQLPNPTILITQNTPTTQDTPTTHPIQKGGIKI